MRQIFNCLGSEQHEPSIAYPSLPKVSRFAELPDIQRATLEGLTSHGSSQAETQSFQIQDDAVVENLQSIEPCTSCGTAPSFSSERWSGDSSYLVADSQGISMGPTEPPSGSVLEWLSRVSNLRSEEIVDRHDGDEHFHHDQTVSGSVTPEIFNEASYTCKSNGNGAQHVSTPQMHRDITGMHGELDSSQLQAQQVRRSVYRSRPDFDDRPSSQTMTAIVSPTSPSEDHVTKECDRSGLSPLSPNVCIERGPYRYHGDRNRGTAASLTPTKKLSMLRRQQRQSKDMTVESRLVTLPVGTAGTALRSFSGASQLQRLLANTRPEDPF